MYSSSLPGTSPYIHAAGPMESSQAAIDGTCFSIISFGIERNTPCM